MTINEIIITYTVKKKLHTHPLINNIVEPMKTHFKFLLKKQSMGFILRFSHLTSTATPFKHMNFSRSRNQRSFVESKNKGIGH
jgi:hypothetical protein